MNKKKEKVLSCTVECGSWEMPERIEDTIVYPVMFDLVGRICRKDSKMPVFNVTRDVYSLFVSKGKTNILLQSTTLWGNLMFYLCSLFVLVFDDWFHLVSFSSIWMWRLCFSKDVFCNFASVELNLIGSGTNKLLMGDICCCLNQHMHSA